MPTLTQAFQLGAERLNAVPGAPHPALESAWAALDWTGAKETALLDALAMAGVARLAGTSVGPALAATESAAEETRPLVPSEAARLLPRLLAEDGRPLLSEWIALCAQRGCLAPPFCRDC
jgi:hypothetical protein